MVGKLNYLTGSQNGYHIRSQCSESVFVSTKVHHLDVVMRILRYLKKALGRGLLYSDHGYTRVASFSYADWVGCPFIGVRSHDIVSFLKETLCLKKTRNRVWSLDPA